MTDARTTACSCGTGRDGSLTLPLNHLADTPIKRRPPAQPGLETINAAASALGEALGNRHILLVVDDVWREKDLRPFLRGGPYTTRLVTTRIDNVLPAGTRRQQVDAMQAGEAIALLAFGLPKDQVSAQTAELTKLAARLGDWAQLLKLVNGFLHDRVVESGETLAQAIVGANKRLDEKGQIVFDPDDEDDRTKTVARTIRVSIDLLKEGDQARFGELGIFPEDADVPLDVVSRLWAQTGGLSPHETEDLLRKLYGLSLLLKLDHGQRTFRIHDTVRHFLQDEAGKEGLKVQHQQLVQAIGEISGVQHMPEAERYVYLHLPHHVAEAGEFDMLAQLLLDPRWLQAKLDLTGNPQYLIDDFRIYARSSAEQLVGQALGLSAGILVRDERQLMPQLLGRLKAQDADGLAAVLNAARHCLRAPAIVPKSRSLTPPGSESSRLEGHPNWVRSLALLVDGRLASAGDDGTVRLWDLESMSENARLEGHSKAVNALAPLPDDRLASGSDDETIRLWDLAQGTEVARLEGHSDGIKALLLLADGRLASGSDDKTIRLWDLAQGAEVTRLEGHNGSVWALAPLGDDRLVSCSEDKTIRLWDLVHNVEIACLKGHGGAVYALRPLPDGLVASGSDDKTIGLWNLEEGTEIACLEGHQSWVDTIAVLADGRLASAGGESKIRLWDLATRVEVACLEKHWGPVSALAILRENRLASAGADGTIWLWDLTREPKSSNLKRHRGWVRALAVLPDRRVASAGADQIIRVWDSDSGEEVARLEGHQGWVRAISVLDGARIASGGADKTIRVWDINDRLEIARLEGHEGWVRALAALPDGQLASGSADKSIRLWHVNARIETARLEGHQGWVSALAALPDGHLASAGADKTIRLWDLKRRREIACLKGHQGWISALLVMPDGKLASASDDTTIRLWDLATGRECGCLTSHNGPVVAIAALSDKGLVSGGSDKTVRLWNLEDGTETTRIEIDAAVTCLTTLGRSSTILAGDAFGNLHWLEELRKIPVTCS